LDAAPAAGDSSNVLTLDQRGTQRGVVWLVVLLPSVCHMLAWCAAVAAVSRLLVMARRAL
jgi:hypothetical protein